MFARHARALLAACAAALLPAAPAAASFKYLKPGMEAPEFTLEALQGREVTLADLKQARASLLVFWATWSPRSEPALREAQALADRFGAAGLRVVAVNVDRPGTGVDERSRIEKTARGYGLAAPVVFDPGFAAASSIGVVANPALALLDGSGVLLWDASGWSPAVRDELRAHVGGVFGTQGEASAGAPARAPRGHVPEHKALLNYNLGRSFLRQGNVARAADLLESAAQIDQAWAAPRTLLGHLLLRQGDRGLQRAEEAFRAAVAIDGEDVSALTGLGEVLLRRDRTDEAAAVLEKAYARDPTFTPAAVGHAQALARLGRPTEALALFDAALDLNPRDAAAFAGRASCREEAGDLGAAAADYRRAVEILIGRL